MSDITSARGHASRSIRVLFLVSAFAFFACMFGPTRVQAQTTEFVYQGQLQNASVPANGNYDFEFLLFDSLGGPTQIGSTLTRSSVAVSAGVFSVKLDFGNQFPGANRFLEIHVRQTGGGGFTPLTPRQAVSSSKYSVKASKCRHRLQTRLMRRIQPMRQTQRLPRMLRTGRHRGQSICSDWRRKAFRREKPAAE